MGRSRCWRRPPPVARPSPCSASMGSPTSRSSSWMNPPAMRLFIAINFPDTLRDSLHAAMEPLRVAAPAARWVDPDRIHLTIKFLGEQPDPAVAPLLEVLGGIAATYDPIPLEVGGLNAFPNLRAPRVVWVGVHADPKLELLQHDIERACEALGHEVDARAYRPHVTVGRVDPREISPARLAAAARSVEFRADAIAESVDLMVSETVDRRARYRVVGSAALSRH